MKLHREGAGQAHRITAYGADYVVIGERRHRASLIVSAERIIDDWAPRAVTDLDRASLEPILALEPEVVLLGTGNRQRFPDPARLACLAERRIGTEVMDSAAACRTFNILLAEGRRVVMALLRGE